MFKTKIEHLNLKQVADSGQCFRWYKVEENRYKICSLDREVTVSQEGNIFTFDCSVEDFEDVWYRYLDLGTDYGGLDSIGLEYNDEFLTEALNHGKGMRILKQPLWEAVLSFVISQNNNIPKIRGSLERIIELNGGKFPSTYNIWILRDRLSEAGVGYRDSYIVNSAEAYNNWVYNTNSDFNRFRFNKDYRGLMKTLQSVKGIGEKVANCICLYGLHCMEACPIDVWMKRVIDEEYNGVIPEWVYSPYAGYYQQLCFYYKRNKGKLK